MTPQPAERTFLIWSGRKKTSVALLGTRSTVEPRANGGLNLFTTWLGVASTMTVWATVATETVRKTVETVNERKNPREIFMGSRGSMVVCDILYNDDPLKWNSRSARLVNT